MAAPLAIVEKDPAAVLTYSIGWGAWLPTGDTVASAVWTVPTGLTNDGTAATTTTVSITLSGGVAGTTYDVSVVVTTTNGLIDKRTLRFNVNDR